MIKREQELLEQIVRALSSTEELSKRARLGLVFSALFELDKIQNGQKEQLTEEQLEEVDSKVATQKLLDKIEATTKTIAPDIQAVRAILKHVMRDPTNFRLSDKMGKNSFFSPYAETSIATAPEEHINGDEVALVQSRQLEWIARQVLPEQYSFGEAKNAQVFVDALRKGNFALVAEFLQWINEKYNDKQLNPEHLDLGMDYLLPIIVYELAHTDIRAEDMNAVYYLLTALPSGNAGFVATFLESGVPVLMSKQSELKSEYPQDSPSQLLGRIVSEYQAFLKEKNPVECMKDGAKIKNITFQYTFDDKEALDFAEQNRSSLAANLILWNTDGADPEDIESLLAIKDHTIELIKQLKTLPPNRQNLICLNETETLFHFLQQNQTIQEKRNAVSSKMLDIIKASSEDINTLFSLKDHVGKFIDILKTDPSGNLDQSNIARLEEVRGLLKVFQKDGTIKENRKKIVEDLIKLNTQNATPENITTLLEVKDHIFGYIEYLENNPPEQPSQTFTNRLNAANQMLNVFLKGGTIEEMIPEIKDQARVIAKNKPGLKELGFLGWLQQNLIDVFRKQTNMSNKTSKTVEDITTVVEFKKSRQTVKQEPVKQKALAEESPSAGPEQDDEPRLENESNFGK